MSKLGRELRKRFKTPEAAIEALGLDPKLLAMDAANPTGKLGEKQEAVANKTPNQREDMPADVFLKPAERTYPVKTKQDGTWKYDRNLLLAAARRARMEGDKSLASRADEIRTREFGSTANDGALNMSHLNSRRAMTARGAILAYLVPKLAMDKKYDPAPVLASVTAKNYKASIPSIIEGVKKGTAGKLAMDADTEDLKALLEAIGEGDDGNDEVNTANPGLQDNYSPEAMDDENSPVHQFLAQKLSPEDHSKAKQLMGDDSRRRAHDAVYDRRADDARKRLGRDETPEEEDEREKKEAAEDARKRLGRDESAEETEKREKDEADDRKRRRAARDSKRADDKRSADDKRRGRADDAPPNFAGMPTVGGKPMVTQQAMDSAIKSATQTAIDTERKNQRAIQTALREVRPYVGELDIAFDSADGVYKKALEMRSTEGLDTIHPSAYRAVLLASPAPGATPPRQDNTKLAMDSKGEKSFFERFPGAKNVRAI